MPDPRRPLELQDRHCPSEVWAQAPRPEGARRVGRAWESAQEWGRRLLLNPVSTLETDVWMPTLLCFYLFSGSKLFIVIDS